MTRDHEQLKLQAIRIDGACQLCHGRCSLLACAMRSAQYMPDRLKDPPLLCGCITLHLSHLCFASLPREFPLPASHSHKVVCGCSLTVRQPLEKRSNPPAPAACRIPWLTWLSTVDGDRRQVVAHDPETPLEHRTHTLRATCKGGGGPEIRGYHGDTWQPSRARCPVPDNLLVLRTVYGGHC
jgi:hypothetical protein